MEQSFSKRHRRLLTGIAAAGAKLARRADGGEVRQYLRAYFANVAAEDLADKPAASLAALAWSQRSFAHKRRRGSVRVRVFNPTLKEHGYTSAHTVVELVADDMPFLVDSMGIVLNQRGMTLHFLAHPILTVKRRSDGSLLSLRARDSDKLERGERLESFQHVEVRRIVDAAEMQALAAQIESNMDDVRVACADWMAMCTAARASATGLAQLPRRFKEASEETQALLEWMEQGHFTFLGYREYRLQRRGERFSLEPIVSSGLGLLRHGRAHAARRGQILSADIRRQARSPELVLVTKANTTSTVHRASYLDYIGVKKFDDSGRLIGERRFLGLWTSSAYSASPHEVPLLRRKVAQVLQHFKLAPDSHDGKALGHILETFPRDELFQSSVTDLVTVVSGIFGLQERPRVRLLTRRDPFRRFISCLVFVPRDKYSTLVRQRIEQVIRDAFAATTIDSTVQISESNLARVHIVAHTLPSEKLAVSVDALERRIDVAVRSWADGLRQALLASFDEATALAHLAKYGPAFPAAYTEDFPPEVAALDIGFLEALERDPNRLHLDIYRPPGALAAKFFLKIFRSQHAIPISDLLPMLENMGLKVIAERPYELELAPGRRAWIQDLELELRLTPYTRIEKLETEFKEAFTAIWSGRCDNDSFNHLTLGAGLSWRQIAVLRAYCRYLLQAGLPFSAGYMAQVLANNIRATKIISDTFASRFDPALSAAAARRASRRLGHSMQVTLDAVTHSDEDRILRAFWNALLASVRTNFYQKDLDGAPKDYLSFKIESRKLPELPLPRPLFEIFVSGARMEGLHLRMGAVARGGIRWSDRREDFRTEILGLMKAQNVKNTVIVPVGAKGGFVVKRMPAGDRDTQAKEVIACYSTLIRGMLDLTDNLVGDAVRSPKDVRRHDGDDPYLVVAADKGTATFSDVANNISAEYGFWLGDAFASGGSAGYDHKKMGITARGGWECVKRHFREIGSDIQAQDFAVVGIGDMSGDVFGNGLLQSKHIKLLAAFNHQHIFLDPNADTERALRERERLFALPRSGWNDYNTKIISKGGGVFARATKTVALPRESQTLLGLPATVTPNEVIKAILKLPVDLLWNGGIGTYIKSSSENHAQIGDRSNDAVRVDARELRCKVIGEGGNLGLSPLARVEFALRGGRINTDFIDNSAGVNCSDIEVNLKILLNAAVHERALTLPERDKLLVRMTGEVAALILRNNYLQSQAISMIESRAKDRLSEHAFVIRALERSGELNRALEFLPSDEDIVERRKAGDGLVRPEIALLLSYSKIWLFKSLIDSDVPEDPYLSAELARYFPGPMQRRFGRRIKRHRLRREIIATAITNSLVNRMGPVFAVRASDDTGATPPAIAKAYSIAREVFQVRDLWAEIERLDNGIASGTQYSMMYETTRLLRHISYWLLAEYRGQFNIEQAVARYKTGIIILMRELPSSLGATELARFESDRMQWISQGSPPPLAARVASLGILHCGLDLVAVAEESGVPAANAAQAYFALGEQLGLSWLRGQIDKLSVDGHWQAVARGTLRDNLFSLQRRMTKSALHAGGRDIELGISGWLRKQSTEADYLRRVVSDMRAASAPDFATLSVALQSVRRLAGA
jgi:glutamate dehydrogenase